MGFFFDFMKKLCWQYGLGWCKKVLESLRHWPYFQQEVLPRHLLVFGFGLRCLIKDTSICIYTHTQFLFCPLSFTSLILVRCCCCCCAFFSRGGWDLETAHPAAFWLWTGQCGAATQSSSDLVFCPPVGLAWVDAGLAWVDVVSFQVSDVINEVCSMVQDEQNACLPTVIGGKVAVLMSRKRSTPQKKRLEHQRHRALKGRQIFFWESRLSSYHYHFLGDVGALVN